MANETLGNGLTLVTSTTGNYYTDCIAEGFVYECSCGEMYNDADVAYHCRKCRNYCVFGYCTHVTDVRTDKVVLGRVPTQEEYKAAQLEAAARWEEERLELAQLMAEDQAARKEDEEEWEVYETKAEEAGY